MASFRLNKVAKDFNVGIQTIVEYLARKGHRVEMSPNTKINEEQYELLATAFQSERMVKEEADRIELLSTEIIQEKEPSVGFVDDVNDSLKIVGKIDLSKFSPQRKSNRRSRNKKKNNLLVFSTSTKKDEEKETEVLKGKDSNDTQGLIDKNKASISSITVASKEGGKKENIIINQKGKKYDVFISYRREGGKDYARIIKPELKSRGLRVFLDFDELKDGRFDKRIMDAIEDAPVFIIILSKGCLDRCVNDGDWVKEEIVHAEEYHRHIVPVEVDKTFRTVPPNIPEVVKSIIGLHQFAQVDTETLLEASINELVERRIRPFINGPSDKHIESPIGAEVHIETNSNCKIFRFGKEVGFAKEGEDNVIILKKGKHKLKFVSISNNGLSQSNVVEIPDNEYSDFIEVNL